MLVATVFVRIKEPLDKIKIRHTDRDREVTNKSLDKLLKTFGIDQSLSNKGSPYDNAIV